MSSESEVPTNNASSKSSIDSVEGSGVNLQGTLNAARNIGNNPLVVGLVSNPALQEIGKQAATAAVVAASKGKIKPEQVNTAFNVASTAKQVYSQTRNPQMNQLSSPPQLPPPQLPPPPQEQSFTQTPPMSQLPPYPQNTYNTPQPRQYNTPVEKCQYTTEELERELLRRKSLEIYGGVETVIAGQEPTKAPPTTDLLPSGLVLVSVCRQSSQSKNILFACLIALLLTIIIIYIWDPKQLEALVEQVHKFFNSIIPLPVL